MTEDLGTKIMLVDDEAIIADCLATVLTDAGYHVVTFYNPKAALAEFSLDPHAWALVVTDQRMPAMEGDALARAMRERRPDLPVVICSGYPALPRDERDPATAIDGFLEKPYDLDVAVDVVRSVLRAKRPPKT